MEWIIILMAIEIGPFPVVMVRRQLEKP